MNLFHNRPVRWVFLLIVLITSGIVGKNIWRTHQKYKPNHVPDLVQRCRQLFDATYYVTTYPDVRGVDPFHHYMTRGWKEDRNPSATFEARFYKHTYQTADPHGPFGCQGDPQHPLKHYVQIGQPEYLITHPAQIKKPTPLRTPKYKLAICAIFWNEGRFLKEWIEYYLLMGVQHFYLCNNASSDNSLAILKPYIDKGLVTLSFEEETKASFMGKHKYHGWPTTIQAGYYTRITQAVAQDVEWLACIDMDEFIVPLKDANLIQLLDRYPGTAALSLNWVMYGSPYKIFPLDKLVTEELVWRQKDSPTRNLKTIVRPRYVTKWNNPHYPLCQKGYLTCTTENLFFFGNTTPSPSSQGAVINHYSVRDNKIADQKETTRKEQRWREKQRRYGEVKDLTIHRYLPALKERLHAAT